MIQEPTFGVTFNYTALKTDLARVITAEDHVGSITLNFCAKSDKKCANGVACYKNRDGKEFVLGKWFQ